jgi:hypothetical protein
MAGALAGDCRGAAGDHDEDGQVAEAFGERGQPVQGLLVGPVRVVHEQHQRPLAPGEPAHRRDQSVAHVLRIGLALARLRYAEGGSGDVVPVAEVLACLVRHERYECGLQQLPYDIERDGCQGLGAARRPHRAVAVQRDPACLGEQCGLPDARLAAEHQHAARVRTGAQRVDGLRDHGEFRVALPQGSLRHPATSPGRPNDVQAMSLVLPEPSWRLVGAPVAVTSDSRGRKTTDEAADQVRRTSPTVNRRSVRGSRRGARRRD